VTDTGAGLKQGDVDRLFREFEQADDSRTRKHGGAGLGLAISQRIVEAMKGTITATAEPGSGAVFTVRIPLEGAAAPVPPRAALADRRVLVLSRNAMEAEAVVRSLHDGAAHVEHVATPEEAL